MLRTAAAARLFRTIASLRRRINYSALAVIQGLVGVIVICHWFACVWGLQASFDPLNAWPGAVGYCVPLEQEEEDGQAAFVMIDRANGCRCRHPSELYAVSFYWSAMTVTSSADLFSIQGPLG